MLALLGVIAWSYISGPAPRERPAAAPLVLPTLPATETPKATEAAFIFVTATPVPPTLTLTPTPTVTQTPENTATSVPVVRPVSPRPTSTARPLPLPAATPTPAPIRFPYNSAGAPVPDASRACKGGFYLYGTVRDSLGRGLANVRLRYVRQFPNPVPLFDRTKSGTEAGYYELYVGLFANDIDMSIIDEAENALSPSAHVSLSGSNCWWVLNWVRNS